MRRLSTIAGTTILLLLPTLAAAYVTPEESLYPAAGYNNLLAPPSHRNSGDRIDEQEQTTRERREAEWQAAYDAQHPKSSAASSSRASSVASEATLEDVLSSLKDSIDDLKSGKHPAADKDPGFDNGMTIDSWENPSQGGSEEVLHSGAPLTPTGPGTWVAVAALIATVGWTLWKVRNGSTVQQNKF